MPDSRSLIIEVALLAGLFALAGCNSDPEPALPTVPSATNPGTAPSLLAQPTVPEELDAGAPEEPVDAAPPPPHPGPWFVVTNAAAGIYADTSFERERKTAYARNGGRLPVQAGDPTKTSKCSSGWYKLVDGGFICGNSGTTDEASQEAKFTQSQPDLNSILPYRYARNSKNGTPLYRSIPSLEEMYRYEPYLDGAKKAAAKRAAEDVKAAAQEATAAPKPEVDQADAGAADIAGQIADAGLLEGESALDGAPSEPAAPEEPWWKRDDAKDILHKVTKEDLESEADGVLAMRMVSGFYIAVDKTFSWNDRRWYKTTKGMVAPVDRFWQTEGSDFRGVELGRDLSLPVGWVYGGNKQATTYEIDEAGGSIKPKGSIKRFEAIDLTGKTTTYAKTTYYETKDGLWVKAAHIRVTEPGPAPEELKPNERWIDINLDQQTIIAFEGETPRYATLISSGKTSSVKAKDHRTPSGSWRIRVKHLTDTMDGDGTAAGDLPYSIEDVPYVMYFHRSYALHAAFWHRNYGVKMSHGCVNLAPLDAKYFFRFAEPKLPSGAHGVFSSGDQPGTLVVVH